MRNKNSLWKKYLILAAMLIFGVCFGTQSALAATVVNKLDIDLTVQLTETASVSPTQVIMHAILPQYTDCDYDIYRATEDPAQGGQLEYLDSIREWGHSWDLDGDYHYTTGPEGKVMCYKYGEMKGGVIFIDIAAELGKTYWYQIVLKDNDYDRISKSNIISGHTILNPPTIRKCYSVSNSSAKILWVRASKAQGYEIYRKMGSGKWSRVKTIKKGKTTSFTNKKLKSGKTYQYKIRSYSKVGGKKIYSKFSTAYKVRTKTPTVKGTYSSGSVYGPSLGTSKLQEVRRVVQSFKDNYIKKGMSDYDKLWMAFCYLRDNCSYAWGGWWNNGANTAWGALVYGEAQCSGYARAMKALCDAIGIDCRYVHANGKAVNPSHQWVQVKLGKKWYVVDPQGGAFLVGSYTWNNYFGMYWDTKSLPKVNKKDHSRGGFAASEM